MATLASRITDLASTIAAAVKTIRSDYARKDGATFTGTVIAPTLTVTGPNGIRLSTTGQGVDSNISDCFPSGSGLTFRFINDAYSAANTWMTVGRTGYAVSSIALAVRPSFNGQIPWDTANFNPYLYLPLTGGVITSRLVTPGSDTTGVNRGLASRPSGDSGFEVRANAINTGNMNDAAAFTFHRPGIYATWFGLDYDNQLAFGGWSEGAKRWLMWTEKNFTPASKYDVPKDPWGSILAVEFARPGSIVNADQYGAIADGATHPLSSKFSTLAAAQVVYALATSLTQEIDFCAVQKAHQVIKNQNGGKVSCRRGRYKFGSDFLDLSNSWNLQIEGDGIDNTVFITSHATNPVFYSGAVDYFRSYKGFSIIADVARTDGAFFSHYNERRTNYYDVKCSKHYNAWDFRAFEATTMFNCYAVDPAAGSTNGFSLRLGRTDTSFASGNFCILSCFFRGNNDIAQTGPVGGYGLISYNVDAIFGFNTDWSGFYYNSMMICPDAGASGFGRSNNNFFVQCFFDATYAGHSVYVAGTGAKTNWSFTGCWFCGAGAFSTVAASKNLCGAFFANQGAYLDINIVGGRAYFNAGAGIFVEAPTCGLGITGLNTNANGFGVGSGAGNIPSDYPYGILINPNALQINACSITGGNHQGNKLKDIYAGPNARLNQVSGALCLAGVDAATPTNMPFIRCDVGVDNVTVASSNNLRLPYGTRFARVTGSQNILNMEPLCQGDIVTLKFVNGGMTMADDQGNLRLAGNYGIAANSKITLQCTGTEWEEMGARVAA